jgi:hypothetical protein
MNLEDTLQIPTTREIKIGIEVAAKFRGMELESLINSLLTDAIRKEKKHNGDNFTEAFSNASIGRKYSLEQESLGVLAESAK